jgi:hypothetical protein
VDALPPLLREPFVLRVGDAVNDDVAVGAALSDTSEDEEDEDADDDCCDGNVTRLGELR